MDCNYAEIRVRRIGLTQAELANTLGCTRSKIQRVEAGRSHYTLRELVQFAMLAQMKVEEMIEVKLPKAQARQHRQPGWIDDYQEQAKEKRQFVDEVVTVLLKGMK